MVLYHYESEQAGLLIEQRGLRIARRGQRLELDRRPSSDADVDAGAGTAAQVRQLPGAVGW